MNMLSPMRHASRAISMLNQVHAVCRQPSSNVTPMNARDFSRHAQTLRSIIGTRQQLEAMRSNAASALVRFRERHEQIALRARTRGIVVTMQDAA
ncbi:MAG: hypothetical protein ABI451_11735 [Dokdonella sp.]